jgi:hypothetical protein
MKRIKNLFVAGLIALTVIITFAVCNNPAGRGPAASVTYSGTTTEGETYTLVIYENESRAVYTPRSGDRYELTITPSNKRSVGVVEDTDGTSLTLKPADAEAPSFTVTVSAAEGGSGHITAITGTVTLEGGETIAGSGIVIPGTGIDEGGEGEGTGGESGEGGDTNTGGSTSVGRRFVAVTDITGVPATAAVGVPLPLTGTVAPANATNKTIVWTVKDAGTTGAVITGSSLTVTALGDATVTATIANGRGLSFPFTKDFTITVRPFVAVTVFQPYWGGG